MTHIKAGQTRSFFSWGLLVVLAASAAIGLRSTTPGVAADDREAFIDRYMDVAEQIDPSLAGRLQSMCQLDPVGFEIVLRRLGPMLSGLADLQADDPDLYQRKITELHLEATVAGIAVEARRAAFDDSPQGAVQREAIGAQLQAMVRAQVLTSIENRDLFVERLREHLGLLELEIEADRVDIEGAVQRRLEDLSGG